MKKVWTVEETALGRNGQPEQSWLEDYGSKEEALASARITWDHLTAAEQEKRLIEVYEDEEDEDEQRRSWTEGYTALFTIKDNIYMELEVR